MFLTGLADLVVHRLNLRGYLQELYFGLRKPEVNHLHWFKILNLFTWQIYYCGHVKGVEVTVRQGYSYCPVQQRSARNCGHNLHTVKQIEVQEQLRHVLFLWSFQVIKYPHLLRQWSLRSRHVLQPAKFSLPIKRHLVYYFVIVVCRCRFDCSVLQYRRHYFQTTSKPH